MTVLADAFQIHGCWAKVASIWSEGVLHCYNWIVELLGLWTHIDWAFSAVVLSEGVLKKVDTPLTIGYTHDWVYSDTVARRVKSISAAKRILLLDFWHIKHTLHSGGSIEEVGVLNSESARVVLQMKCTPSSPQMRLLSWLRSKDIDRSRIWSRGAEIVKRVERGISDKDKLTDLVAIITPLIISPLGIRTVRVACILSHSRLVLLHRLEEVSIGSILNREREWHQIVIGDDSSTESNARELRAVYNDLRTGRRERHFNEGIEIEVEVFKEAVGDGKSASSRVSIPIRRVESDKGRRVVESTTTSIKPSLVTCALISPR